LGPHILNQGADQLSPSKNPYSWNNKANLLFLESPPGVGFSINKDASYIYNDTRTAQDNLLAIKQWYKKFPEFSQNRLWVSGESYCGMYIPLLAEQLLNNRDTIIDGGKLDFQGVLIGNGVMLTELHWRRQARNTFYSRHYFYGPEIQSLIGKCKYNSSDDINPACLMGNKLADESVKRNNPYNSIGICYAHTAAANGKPRSRFWYTPFDEEMYRIKDTELGCSTDDSGILAYFNDKTVQQQLHVPDMQWSPCSDEIGELYKKDLTTLPLFEKFKASGLKVLLYSGNVDAQVSYIETEEYVRRIGWKVTQSKKSVLNTRGSL
jgi:serine carboxypeptidase-like clade 2